jgi:signal transduction histidine kinase/DNA-binding response OmpR family regulator
MPSRTQRKVALGFATGILVFAAIGGAAYGALRRMDGAADAERRSVGRLLALDAVDQLITEAETGQRGYLLTGEDRYLNPYRRAVEKLPRLVAAVRAEARPAQHDKVEHLISLMDGKRGELAETVELWGAGRRNEALAVVRTARGLALMDSLRADLGFLRAAELSELDERRHDARAEAERVGLVITLGVLLALAVAVVATGMVARDERSRDRARSELERTRDTAERASRAKSEFLARMSHELRTPLNAVIGFSGILMRNKRGVFDDRDLSYLRRIQTSGTQLLTIINDILDLSKVESGRMDVTLGACDVLGLVRERVEQFASLLAGRDVTLALDLPKRLDLVRTDADKLRQVLGNLLSNAVKFTENGRVLVRVVSDSAGVRVARIDVIDSGIGIADSRQAAIFGAFEQAESDISRRFGGTGLGLAISRSICERLRLRLVVMSEEGVGSTFSILFDPSAEGPSKHLPPVGGTAVVPARPTAPASELASERATDAGAPLVLIVDDSADSRLLLTQYVDDFGFQSIAAVNGEQGMQMALEFRPELILLDLQMPGMNGWEMIQRLKAHRTTEEIPVVIVSIMGGEEQVGLVGVVDVVPKPVNRDALYVAMRRNLHQLTGRVLIVDDSPDATRLLQAHLEEFPGIVVQTAENGRVALKMLPGFRPDLVILDLMMPDMDGHAFLEHLRADPELAHLPVLVVTGQTLTAAEQRALEQHATAVLHKGVAMGEELRRTLRRTLQRVRDVHVAAAQV